jgi:hypothetical protein
MRSYRLDPWSESIVCSKTECAILPYHGISMCGTFRLGDLLLIDSAAIEDLRRGDVVAFRRSSTGDRTYQVVHRIQAFTPEGLITRGDRSCAADLAPVTAEDLIGRVSAVERDGETRPVLGGWRGHAWAIILRLWRRIAPVVGGGYRFLRATGLTGVVWRPPLSQIHLEAAAGPVVKTVHRERTVARWWPAEGRFWCRKPYDLILPRPDAEVQSRRA